VSNVRDMLARVTRLEAARALARSPIELTYGSFSAFEDQSLAMIDEWKLRDRGDMLAVLTVLCRWHVDRVWAEWR
jgi:hypothetical protein